MLQVQTLYMYLMLLKHINVTGVVIDAIDKMGDTSLSVAAKLEEHKSCECHLFLFQWQECARQK